MGSAIARGLFGWALANPQAAQEVVVATVEGALGAEAPSVNPVQLGAKRVAKVASIVGGTALESVGKQGMKVVAHGIGATDVDVLGKAGELIAV